MLLSARVSTLLPLLAASLLACTAETTTTTPPSTVPPEETPPAAEPETPPATPPPAPPVAQAPKVAPDASFAAIEDKTNTLGAAIPADDGSIYASFRKAGGAIGWGSGTLVRHYLASGSLDASFATGGTLTTTLVANPNAIGLDGSGRVLVGGTGLYDPDTTNDSGREIVVVRTTKEGAVDTTYGSSGRAILSFSPANTFTTSLAVRSGGGAFVSVYGRTNGNESYGSFLVDEKGAAVKGWGPGGFQSSDYPTDAAFAFGDDIILPGSAGLERIGASGSRKDPLLLAPAAFARRAEDGAVLAVVASKKGNGLELARYTPSGVKDTAFVGVPVDDSLRDIVLLRDGSALLADAKGISWIAKTGGAGVAVVPGTLAEHLYVTADGKLLVVTKEKVLRYTLG